LPQDMETNQPKLACLFSAAALCLSHFKIAHESPELAVACPTPTKKNLKQRAFLALRDQVEVEVGRCAGHNAPKNDDQKTSAVVPPHTCRKHLTHFQNIALLFLPPPPSRPRPTLRLPISLSASSFHASASTPLPSFLTCRSRPSHTPPPPHSNEQPPAKPPVFTSFHPFC